MMAAVCWFAGAVHAVATPLALLVVANNLDAPRRRADKCAVECAAFLFVALVEGLTAFALLKGALA